MAKFNDFSADVEVRDIAEKLQKKYPMFEKHDLDKVYFARIRAKDCKEVCKTAAFGFPADSVVPYIYYVLTFENKWNLLSNEQKIAAVFQQLFSMEEDGFDVNSNKYGRVKRRDVAEYSEVLCAVGMRYDWAEIGVKIPNLLELTVEASEESTSGEELVETSNDEDVVSDSEEEETEENV